MPRSAASRAALTTLSTDSRLTPGIEVTGSHTSAPSRRKTGQIRSPVVSVFSWTSARICAFCRVRRNLVAGKGAWLGFMVFFLGFGVAKHWHGNSRISRVGIAAKGR